MPLATGVGLWLYSWPGAIAGALGCLLGFGFFLITALSVTLVSSRAPSLVEAVVLGGWLIKLIVFILIFAGLRDVTWLNDVVFAVSVAIAALTGLVIEVWVVMRAKGTYVDPE